MKRDDIFQNLSISTVWGWLCIFALVPSLLVFITSILSSGDTELVRLQITLDNYLALFDLMYLRVFLRSLWLAFLCTLCCLVLAFPFAYLLTRMPERHRGMLLLLVIIPLWTSSLIRSYAIVAILKTHGLLNNFLLWAGFISSPLQLMYTNSAVLVGLVYSLFPLMVLPLYANIEKLDRNLIDAAKDLGANRYHVFSKIILPLTLPGILAGSMLVFLPAMTIFYIPDLLGGAKTLLLGNMIQNQFLTARNWPMGATLSVMLIAIMGLMLIAYWRVKQNSPAREPLR